jgi:hypothetical protein
MATDPSVRLHNFSRFHFLKIYSSYFIVRNAQKSTSPRQVQDKSCERSHFFRLTTQMEEEFEEEFLGVRGEYVADCWGEYPVDWARDGELGLGHGHGHGLDRGSSTGQAAR